MTIQSLRYIANDTILSRKAANLVYSLANLKGDVFLIKDDKTINGKSLVGVLHLDLRGGQEVEIHFNNPKDREEIIKIFNEIGQEVV